VLKPLLNSGDLCRLGLYRRHIILERRKLLPLLPYLSLKRFLSLLECVYFAV
jgi:hypothetical protein